MIVEREKGLNSRPIITQEHIDFIKEQYNNGLSQVNIAKIMCISPKLISIIMKANNINIRSNREKSLKNTVDEDYFETINTEYKAYWLGFMYADGFIVNKAKHSNYKIGITLTESDTEHLYKFKKSLNSTNEVKTYESKSKNKNSYNTKPYSRILISSNKLALDLINLGCFANKTFKINFPNINQVPSYLIQHFIRGYIDGDGSITHTIKPNGKILIMLKIVGTKEFLEGIKKCFNVQHLKIHKRHKDRDVNNYSLSVGGNIQTLNLLDWIYGEATIFLNRKYNKYKEVKNLYLQQKHI